jgi:hypothetical protein
MNVRISPASTEAIIIWGPNNSGRSTLALQIAALISPNVICGDDLFTPDPVILQAESFKTGKDTRFVYSECDETTSVIIIENCPADFYFDQFFNVGTTRVLAEAKGDNPFYISPKFIFVANDKPVSTGASFDRRFHLIETTKNKTTIEKDGVKLLVYENRDLPF